MEQWLTLNATATRFVFEAVRGGFYDLDDKGDICIDDVMLSLDECSKISSYLQETLYC